METKYLTVEDLKNLLHIGNTKAYKLCETKGFPAFRLGEGRWLIDPQGLDEWVKKLQKTATKTFMLNVTTIDNESEYTTEEIKEIMKLLEADEDV